MRRYIEYDTESGRIISEIRAKSEPICTGGKAVIEIGEDENIDITRYKVIGGVLVKTTETNQERQERLRLKREYGMQSRNRVQSMIKEFVIAQLDEDESAKRKLIEEFRKIKRYL